MKSLVLDATNKSITIQLAGAIATTNPDYTSHYADDTGTAFTEGSANGVLNGVSVVTVVGSPAASTRRIIKNITVTNVDTASVTLIVKYVEGANTRVIQRVTLGINETWTTDGTFATDGSLKTGAISSIAGQLVLTAAGGWSSLTNGASAISQVETATNKVNYFVTDFLQSVQSYFEWAFALPSDYNGGSVTAQFYWLANSASTNSVVWGIAGRSYGDNTAIDAAYGTAIEVTDANNGTNTVNISATTSPMTFAGSPAASQYCQLRVYRLGSGADNLAATGRLLAVRITYTRA